MSDVFRNILIIKPSSLGDVVMALPALSALRESFPDAKISWLIRPEFAQLIENHPHLDEVILFDRRFLGKAWYSPRALAALVSLIKNLRSSRFDAVVDLQGLFRTAALSRLSGCKLRLGPRNARELGHIFYTDRVAQDMQTRHVVDFYLKIVRTLGGTDKEAKFILPTDPAAVESTRKLLEAHNVRPDNYAVLVPGATRSEKCWPVERFAAIAKRIAAEFGLCIVATGAGRETALVERLQRAADVPITSLAGKTSLKQLVALLKGARIVVSNDTGPGHIAAALARPLVMIFGPVNPARLLPYNRPQCVAAVNPDGRGLEIENADPRYNIENITIDEVFKTVRLQLRV